ncbi:MAG: RICIN domain-containing protein [Saccharospirillaceae bacterium]|nr:RICIN domain-containing protein [Saccharospirillaceae bacterium]
MSNNILSKLVVGSLFLAVNSYSLPIGVVNGDNVSIKTKGLINTTTYVDGKAHIDLSARYIYDKGTKTVYTKKSKAIDWNFTPTTNGFYQIRSKSRPGGCIYDPKRTTIARFDKTCNYNWPRNEWRLEKMYNAYRIRNKTTGYCMEADSGGTLLRVKSCSNNNDLQLFYID